MAEKKMTMAEMKAEAKRQVAEILHPALENAEMVGAVAYVPVTVNGQEIWVEVKLTSKQWTKTSVSGPFDPFEAQTAYEEELRLKEQEAAAKEKAKEDLARQKAARGRSKKKTTPASEEEKETKE